MIDKKPNGRRPSRKPAATPRPRKTKRATRQPREERAVKAPRPTRAARVEPKQALPPAPTESPQADDSENLAVTQGSAFPIVGIGASAGGLEALEQFLSHVTPKSGAAYVVIQHLSPSDKGMLVELLQRTSTIPVEQARDLVRVEPDHCYVTPPNFDISLMHGTLHLLQQSEPRRLNRPIDFFLRSLAEDQQERAIGVILSGMGFDGTVGLRAIRERGGAAFVEALTSAKFDGMPRSAIDAGLADVIAPVGELPARIAAYHGRAPYFARPHASPDDRAQSALEKVFLLLRAQTGNDFFLYKRSTILRRIERRMGLHQIENIANYVRYLRENPREIDLLFKELLIGVTSFFRDAPTWEHLTSEIMPSLLAPHALGGSLRAWVPGCSTGEEAYSLAMVFKEALDPLKPTTKNIRLQIFASDLDRDAIEKARQGLYSETITADVSPERLRRFFVQEERGYRICKEIREMVVFAPQNIIMDPPFTKLDMLSCRNLLIYLSGALQKKLIPLFHYSLNPNGVLLLGSAETVGGFSNLFQQLDAKTRFYRKLREAAAISSFELASAIQPAPAQPRELENEPPIAGPPPANLERLADRVLVQRFSPLGVLCTEKGDILYVSGRAGKYFEPAVGKANLNIFAMARDGLRYELSKAFATALRENRAVIAHGINVRTNGHTQPVDLTVQKLADPKELRGAIMIVIADAAPRAEAKARERRRAAPPQLAELEHDLQRAREEVQTTREEMQTSQEELKSTNEELQSANEELQSTNEELTTSKEEMQSLNEELQTVNQELQSKVEELSRSNSDMKNLLNSTDIATLFLDDELRVRRFTTQTAKIIKLIPGDAGRLITDIRSDLDYPELADDAREVLRTLVFKQRHSTTRDGRWFLVRIMPYRTFDDVIDGVVITFTDASASRALQESLVEQASQLKQMAESLPILVWNCKPDGSCDYVSRRWVEYTGVPAPELFGYGWLERVHLDDRERVRDAWRTSVRTSADFNAEFRIRGANGTYRWFQTRAVAIRDNLGHVQKWYGTNADVDHMARGAQTHQLDGWIASLVENVTEGCLAVDSQMALVVINPAAERLLHCRADASLGKNLFDVLQEPRGGVFEKNITAAFRNGERVVFEHDLSTPHGPFRFRVFPHYDPEGVAILFEAT